MRTRVLIAAMLLASGCTSQKKTPTVDPGTTPSVGNTGEAGAMGPMGPKGDMGPAGPQGLPGADGARGHDGSPGEPGQSGGIGQAGTNGKDYDDFEIPICYYNRQQGHYENRTYHVRTFFLELVGRHFCWVSGVCPTDGRNINCSEN